MTRVTGRRAADSPAGAAEVGEDVGVEDWPDRSGASANHSAAVFKERMIPPDVRGFARSKRDSAASLREADPPGFRHPSGGIWTRGCAVCTVRWLELRTAYAPPVFKSTLCSPARFAWNTKTPVAVFPAR